MVIKGWEVGIASMQRDELCVLTCRAEYAYGRSGHPPAIPPNATLQFEVELFSWSENQEEANSLWPSGLTFFAILTAVFAAFTKQRRTYSAVAVALFAAALYLARRPVAYLAASMERAAALKESATSAFAAGHFGEALDLYTDATERLEGLVSDAPPAESLLKGARYPDDEEAARALMIACLLNQASCRLKLGEWELAERCCARLLDGSLLGPPPEGKGEEGKAEHTPAEPAITAAQSEGASPARRREQYVKALYRRAHAQMELERFAAARADLLQASALDPRSREVRAMYAACGEREAASKKREDAADRGLYAKMFRPGQYDIDQCDPARRQ